MRAPQFPGDGRPGIARAGGVNQHAHGDAAFDGVLEGGDKFLSAGVVVENIGAERDGFFGRGNRGEHGGKRGVAGDEGLEVVSRQERLAGDAADDAGNVLEVLGARGFRFAEIFRDGAAQSVMDAELDGAAADAVDAEGQVEQGTPDGHGPDDDDPDGGGAGVALMQQGVAGGQQTGQRVKSGGDVRPELLHDGVPVHRRVVWPKTGRAQAREQPGECRMTNSE